MSIPLDRLYPYIERVAQEARNGIVDLRRFYPYGSKDIANLTPIQPILQDYQKHISPMIFCNDQEPLDFDRYADVPNDHMLEKYKLLYKKHNIKKYNFQCVRYNIYDKSLLVHSEKRSTNLEKYCKNEFIPVYYWSHAVISLDWFRFAQYLQQQKHTKKTFLIYNRSWAGTREYRLRFAESLIHLNLQEHCKTSINPIEPELGVHYGLHAFKNPQWRPQTVLENYFPISNAHSHYSADFDIEDYESTAIEVVLETLFDDSRLHLTEKSLRPIACAQPFILAGTHGSLEYLRSYGFKTFGDIWDESYDLVEDPAERLIQIAELMKYISNWLPHQRERNLAEAQAIADYNKKHFFSEQFSQLVLNELKDNLTSALEELETTNTSKIWFDRRMKLWNIPEFKESWFESWFKVDPTSYWPGRTRQDILKVVARARYYYNRSIGSTNI
jgi:hypothetical protein